MMPAVKSNSYHNPGIQSALLKLVLLVLAASALPTVSAARDCWIDSFGRRHCRLSTGVKIAIAASTAAASILLLLALFLMRRRRMARANQAFVYAQQHQQAYNPYGSQPQYGNAGYNPSYTTQYQGYPPQEQGYNYYNYNQQGGFAPPQGAPQQLPPEYAPPRSPPPTAAKS